MTNTQDIRNFCVIAHIDHGKSTLADRLLEFTHTVPKRQMKDQLLDQMDLERERGITIKLQPVQMKYTNHAGRIFTYNLIDTPGHADFSYEVSRTLAAVEGAVLLVDATQGIEAQTLSHLYLAMQEELAIIPVINKIDLPNSDVPKVTAEITKLLGVKPEEILTVSGKTGQNVDALLDAIWRRVPPPEFREGRPFRGLIFDSKFDDYRGVVAYVRCVDGRLTTGQPLRLIGSKSEADTLEVGCFTPKLEARPSIETGQIGYIVTGLKEVAECRVGDTIVLSKMPYPERLPGYQDVKPMVFAGLYAREGNDYPKLRDAVDKLKLNDAAFTFEPENFPALGFGFRAGFLGLLHLEIVQERLRREYNLDLVVTAPGVAYRVTRRGQKQSRIIHSPQELPKPEEIEMIEEPWLTLDIVSPSSYIGAIMQLVQEGHGVYKDMEYLDAERVIIHNDIPLSSVIVDFYDRLKSVTRGYASMNYEYRDYHKADLVKLDILLAESNVEPLATIVRRDEAYHIGRRVVENLKTLLTRQMFEVKIQAAISGKIIASARLSAMRKDVTAKLYGGDVTRKRKLLEKQKKGKKRMMAMGQVELPTEAYLSLLRRK
ncbi:MAG: translation elongation factor 4 [Patescibacteria group bacterium]